MESVWLYATPPPRQKVIGQNRKRLQKVVHGPFVRAALGRAGLPTDEAWRSQEWEAAYKAFFNVIVGVALMRPLWEADVMQYLCPQQRFLREYWEHVFEAPVQLIFFQFVDACKLSTLMMVRTSSDRAGLGNTAPNSLIFNLTEFSLERLLAEGVVPGVGPVADVLRRWRAGPGRPSDRPLVACCMPAQFALLCSCKGWTGYAFPLRAPRPRGTLGLRCVANTARNVALASATIPEETADFRAERFQEVADSLRLWAPTIVAAGHDAGDLHNAVDWLQAMSDVCAVRTINLGSFVYSVDQLISAVTASALLRNAADLTLAVKLTLALVLPRAMAEYMAERLQTRGILPGKTFLYTHRLTLHLAWCLMARRRNDGTLADPLGVVRFGTVDASAVGRYDWVWQAAVTIPLAALPEMLAAARTLINGGASAGQQDAAMELLRSKLQFHLCSPTAVGSGQSNKVAKMHCLLHACRMECNSWAQTVALLNATQFWTTDMGTESLIASHPTMGLDALCPWASPDENVDFDFEEDGDGARVEAGGRPEANVLKISMASSLHIPGVLHIIHLATERVTESLHYWPTFLEQLTVVTNLVRQPWTQERLVQTCFHGAGDVFKGFSGHVYQGRWGSVAHAVRELSRVSAPLRLCWDLQKYMMNAPAPPAAGHPMPSQRGDTLALVDEAISSKMFWAYVEMINSIGATLLGLMEWAEGCPCHPRPTPQGEAEDQDTAAFSCPMRSRKCPEMVAGELFRVLDQLAGYGNRWLSASTAGLDQADRDIVLQDYARARSHLAFYFRIKLAFWSFLPYALLGLGHACEQQARFCAATCLALFDSMPQDFPHFPLTLAHCTGEGRRELEQYAQGAPLASVPTVELLACKGRFITITERMIEGVHAKVTKDIAAAPHHSAAHVAYMSIRQQLSACLVKSPSNTQWFRDFADCCSQVRNLSHAVQRLGFDGHPLLQSLMQRATINGKKHRKAIVQVLYHCDGHTLFQDWGAILPCDPPEGPRPPPASLEFVASQPPKTGAVERLWCEHAIEHVRDIVAGNANVLLSLGPFRGQPVALALPDLRTALQPQAAVPTGDFAFELEGSDDAAAPQLAVLDLVSNRSLKPQACNVVFFKVLDFEPGRHKTVSGVAGLPSLARGLHNPVAVAMDVLEIDRAAERILLSLEAASGAALPPVVLPLSDLSQAELSSLRVWELGPTHHRIGSGVVPHLAEAARALVPLLLAAQGRPQGDDFVLTPAADRQTVELLQKWLSLGIVCCRALSADATCWCLTESGVRLAQTVHWASKPVLALTPRAAKAPTECNTFELMHMLQTQGWVCKVLEGRKAAAVDYDAGDASVARVWWVRANARKVSRLYLLALHTAAAIGKPIKHVQPNWYYQSLLAGEEYVPRAVGRDFTFLTDAAADLPKARRRKTCRAPARALALDREACEEGEDEEEPGGEEGEDEEEEGGEEREAGEEGTNEAEAVDANLDGRALVEEDCGGSVSETRSSTSTSDSSATSESASESESEAAPAAGKRARTGTDTPPEWRTAATHFWRDFKFTPRFKDGVHQGWEATCYKPAHGKQCRRTATFRDGADEILIIRRLRFWCLQGAGCPSRQSHQGLTYRPVQLPEVADLEEMNPTAAASSL